MSLVQVRNVVARTMVGIHPSPLSNAEFVWPTRPFKFWHSRNDFSTSHIPVNEDRQALAQSLDVHDDQFRVFLCRPN